MVTGKNIISSGYKQYKTAMYSWEVIDVCQYKCSYCSAMNFNLNKLLANKILLDSWKNVIKTLTLKTIKNPYMVELLGGEPTLHPNIEEIIQQLNAHDGCVRIDLITNLEKNVKFYKQLQQSKLYINPSYHPEFSGSNFVDKVIELNNTHNIICNNNLHDNSTYWERTKNTIDTLTANDINFYVNFLFEVESGSVGGYKPTYNDDFFSYFENYLTSDNLRAPCRLQKHGNVSSETNINVMDALHNNAHIENIDEIGIVPFVDASGDTELHSTRDIIKHDMAKFKGWDCDARMYSIKMTGEIYNHCTGETVTPINIHKKLNDCVTCPLDRCDCDTKFLYYKSREE